MCAYELRIKERQGEKDAKRGSPTVVLPVDFQFMTLFCDLFHLPRRMPHSPG